MVPAARFSPCSLDECRNAQPLADEAGENADGKHRDERQHRHRLEPGMRRHGRAVMPAEMGDERGEARNEDDAQILHEGDEAGIGAVALGHDGHRRGGAGRGAPDGSGARQHLQFGQHVTKQTGSGDDREDQRQEE